jgi:hypothetical protein
MTSRIVRVAQALGLAASLAACGGLDAPEVPADAPPEPKLPGYREITTVYEKIVPIPAAPGVDLIDDELSLGAYARFADTAHLLASYAIERPDGNGGWVATDGGPNYDQVWDLPAQGTEGYEVELNFLRGPGDRPFAVGPRPTIDEGGSSLIFAVGTETGGDVNGPSFDGGNGGISHGESRLRVWFRRSARVYSPEEQAAIDALGYRLHVLVQVQNFCVWEKEVPIVGAHGDYLMEEDVDLAEFGLVGGMSNHVWVAEFRRNGRTIRSFLQREYRDGERFDPPTLPVGIMIVPKNPLAPWSGATDSEKLWRPERYGRSAWPPGFIPDDYPADEEFVDGIWIGSHGGYCNTPNVQQTVIRIRRWGAPRASYVDGSGYVPGALDLSTVGTGGMQGILRTKQGWVSGAVVHFVGDSASGVAAELASGGMVLVVHFQPGLSTLRQAWDAIDALPLHAAVRTGALANPDYVLQAGDTDPSGYGWSLNGSFPEVPVPAGSTDGCSLRLRLLAAPGELSNRQYPWIDGG